MEGRSTRIDHTAVFSSIEIAAGIHRVTRRHVVALTREVGTDDVPAVSTVRGFEKYVSGEVQSVGIDRRENHGSGPEEPVISRPHCFRTDVLHLAGSLIEATDLPAVNDVRVKAIRGDVAGFLDPDRIPLPESDRAVIPT